MRSSSRNVSVEIKEKYGISEEEIIEEGVDGGMHIYFFTKILMKI